MDLSVFKKIATALEQDPAGVLVGILDVRSYPLEIIFVPLARLTLQHVVLVAKVPPLANIVGLEIAHRAGGELLVEWR